MKGLSVAVSAVYYNWGRWVVDCPVSPCADARAVTPGQTQMVCNNGHTFNVNWPPEDLAAQIVAVLAERPERWRSWFPADHPLAVATGQPHGQTVEELRAESEWLRSQSNPAPSPAAGQPPLAEMLSAYGLALGDDGTTLRRL